jgi:hypothetical protein
MNLSDHTTLERVRLKFRRTPEHATVARSRLSHLLASVSLTPPSMPPSAILLVRDMTDPLPGRISVGFAPGPIATAEWETAARRRLGEFYRGAVRPIREPAPAGAAAVLFADYAELLACMARDISSGATSAWWWRSLSPRVVTPSTDSWVSVWTARPRYVPAALSLLRASGRATDVLRRITPAQAWALLTTVSRAFDLPGLTEMPTANGTPRQRGAPPETAAPALPAGSTPDHLAASVVEDRGGASLPTRLPWEPHVSRTSTPSDLGYERQALLGFGLLLHQSPQVAATAAFGLRFRAWVSAEAVSRGAHLDGTAKSPHPKPAESFRPRAEQWRHANSEKPAGIDADPRRPTRSSIAPARTWRVRNEDPPNDGDRETEEAVSVDRPWFPTAEHVRPSPAPDQPIEQPHENAVAAPPRGWESGIFTRAGGVLFLIHALRQAALLQHFDTGLGGWAVIELLARCLLEDTEAARDDPIWDVLAHLDGRARGVRPALEFTPQRTYAAPPAWLDHAGGTSRFARFRARGFEICTDEGFLVLDTEDASRPPCMLKRMTPRHRRAVRRLAAVRPIGLGVGSPLRRFLRFVLPYVRWRLEQALNEFPPREALSRPGMLYVTATHVDLVMSLNEVSVPVRMAGLDANPGWVPELGRVVAFHFEREGPGIG